MFKIGDEVYYKSMPGILYIIDWVGINTCDIYEASTGGNFQSVPTDELSYSRIDCEKFPIMLVAAIVIMWVLLTQ